MIEHDTSNLDLPTEEKLAARRNLSHRFLDEAIADIQGGKVSSVGEFRERHQLFILENQGLGDDFDLANTWGVAEIRSSANKYMLEHGDERLPNDAVDVEIALAFLEEIVFGQPVE